MELFIHYNYWLLLNQLIISIVWLFFRYLWATILENDNNPDYVGYYITYNYEMEDNHRK